MADFTDEKSANGDAVVNENGDVSKTKKEEVIKEEPIKEATKEEAEKEKGDGDSKETVEGVDKTDDKPEEKKKELKAINFFKKS